MPLLSIQRIMPYIAYFNGNILCDLEYVLDSGIVKGVESRYIPDALKRTFGWFAPIPISRQVPEGVSRDPSYYYRQALSKIGFSTDND